MFNNQFFQTFPTPVKCNTNKKYINLINTNSTSYQETRCAIDSASKRTFGPDVSNLLFEFAQPCCNMNLTKITATRLPTERVQFMRGESQDFSIAYEPRSNFVDFLKSVLSSPDKNRQRLLSINVSNRLDASKALSERMMWPTHSSDIMSKSMVDMGIVEGSDINLKVENWA